MICKEYKNDLEKIRRATAEELSAIAGIGGVIGTSVEEYFKDEEHNRWLNDLMKELELEQNQEPEGEQTLDGKIFVITGSLEHFSNRNELKELIRVQRRKGDRKRYLQDQLSHQQ